MAGKKDLYIQAVRGLAIAAVVLIHCLPQEAASVTLRPFLNFAVAAFVFLSGYLTPREKAADADTFLRRRLGKIAAPYVVWTILYLVARGAFAPLTVLTAFVVGGSAQLYYLVVYLQLVLLTPLLFRLLGQPVVRAALYAVTPLTLCVRYALSVVGISLPIQAFCGFTCWGSNGAVASGRGCVAGVLVHAIRLLHWRLVLLCRSWRVLHGSSPATTTSPPRSSRSQACFHRRARVRS